MHELSVKCLLYAVDQALLAPSACELVYRRWCPVTASKARTGGVGEAARRLSYETNAVDELIDAEFENGF
ncbi:hypothetical protein EVAR_100253_1 [Eumeta japonica]|uniref:Uncharacterized protein n=1 Tax=Eumeta variegata TaxID=151549 RepID=A0A4C2AC65_EUMVA|nr:hypothetical protein EVAR_100253_1 [Eumeta japonica]